MGDNLFIFLHIYSLDKHSIGIGLVAVESRRSYDVSIFIGDLCVARQNSKGVTREHFHTGRFKRRPIPFHDSPMAEHIVFRIIWRRRGTGNSFGLIHIRVAIRRSIGTRTSIVFHIYTICADQLAAPLRVEIHLADGRRIGRIDLIRGVESAIPGDHGRVGHEGIKAERMGKLRIRIPAGQLIVDPGAAHITDHVTVIHIEGITRSGIIAGVAVGVNDGIARVVVGDKVDRVLIAAPLGVEGYVMRRHGVEGIGIASAKLVIIPAQEGIPIQSGRERIGVAADVRLKVDVASRVKVGAGCRGICQRISAAVHKGTVTIGDTVLVASVANVQIVIDIAGVPITAYIFSTCY